MFQVLFSICYFAVYLGLTFFLFSYYGVMEQIHNLSAYFNTDQDLAREKYMEIIGSENFRYVTLWIVVITALLFPLNLGLLIFTGKWIKPKKSLSEIYLLALREAVSLNILVMPYFGEEFIIFLNDLISCSSLGFINLVCRTFDVFNNLNIQESLKLSFQAVGKIL